MGELVIQMTDAQKNRLLDFKARQESGEHLPCPRCGCDSMKPALYTNALSRAFDIMICDECGTDEAVRAFAGEPVPIEEWACMKEE